MPYFDSANYELPFQTGSETSRSAATQAQRFVSKQGHIVLAWFQSRGLRGGTQKECSAALGIARASICARCHALEQVGNLVKTSERRQNCAVYRVNVLDRLE